MPGRNIRGERFVAHGRVNEEPGRGENSSETESAGGAALVFRVGLRHVLVAVASVDFHFRAAIRLDHLNAGHLARQRRERDRGTNQQANAGAQDRSHFSILGAAGESRKAADSRSSSALGGAKSNTAVTPARLLFVRPKGEQKGYFPRKITR